MTKVTFLGTGTSNGVPVIGCTCPTCLSSDPRDKRWRSSILIERGDTKVVIDTGYEFRLQCIRAGIDRLDAVLYTHEHPDHLYGLDDLRAFCTRGRKFPIYGTLRVLSKVNEKFPYAFLPETVLGVPRLEKHVVEPHVPFTVGEIEFIPIVADHFRIETTGYRFGSMAYVTDVSDFRMETNRRVMEGVDTLIIGALRKDPHVAHLTFRKAIEVAEELGARRIYFTHINHETMHRRIEEDFSPRAYPAYDTLVVEAED